MTVALDLKKYVRWFVGLSWLVVACHVAAQSNASASITRIEPTVLRGQLSIDIDSDLRLNDTMQRALSRGVPLVFSIDLQIERPRWWWFNKTIVDTALQRRLSFDTLTRSWRVSTGDLSITAGSFSDAMKALRHVHNWPIVLTDRFEPQIQYIGRVRIRLDSDQLARPLQMDTINRTDWTLVSPWQSFEFSIRRLSSNGS